MASLDACGTPLPARDRSRLVIGDYVTVQSHACAYRRVCDDEMCRCSLRSRRTSVMRETMEGLGEGRSATAEGASGFGVPAAIFWNRENVSDSGWSRIVRTGRNNRGRGMRNRAESAVVVLEHAVVLVHLGETNGAQ